MRAVVVGAGRVGSAVARALDADGWDVTVVDEREESLTMLGENWKGGFVLGHGIDTTVLERAGIAEADVFVASTNGDNTNIVVARTAREHFQVPRVVARIYDPRRARVPPQTPRAPRRRRELSLAHCSSVLEDALRIGDDHDLARRVAQDVVDRRAEEA